MTPAVEPTLARVGRSDANVLLAADPSPRDLIDYVNRYNYSNPAWRVALIHRLTAVAEENESKQKSAFRSSTITLFAVLLALASLLVPPALETIFGAGSSSSELTQLERRMDDAGVNLQNLSRVVQEQREVDPTYTVPQDQLREMAKESYNSIDDYYAALDNRGWANVRAGIALGVTIILGLLVVWLWFDQKTRAREADCRRARAATWLKLFSEQRALIKDGTRKRRK
ncbi:hypothetical protein GW571_13310 [Clavibacter capsici]|uniref:hypothetical protein n=1 Tax=Clavibacter capsici TaxID=1874630 RepID=UPI0014284E67|nr:hypothetical protein [Clavibacter capsici]QIS43041.1 hypothetical protein GW571_13310 [Clavibacter capsici]